MLKLSSPASRVLSPVFDVICFFAGFNHRFALKAATFLIFAFWPQLHYAQPSDTKYDPATYKDKPVWIDMMKDPNANFYETLRAFRSYWEGYEMPEEPEETEQNDHFMRDIGWQPDAVKTEDTDIPEPLPERVDINGNDLLFEVKQFKGWFRNAQPWVQKNGLVMPIEERQQLIDRQRKELKEVELKQKRQ